MFIVASLCLYIPREYPPKILRPQTYREIVSSTIGHIEASRSSTVQSVTARRQSVAPPGKQNARAPREHVRHVKHVRPVPRGRQTRNFGPAFDAKRDDSKF